MNNVLPDIGQHYTQYVMSIYSMLLTNISIFATKFETFFTINNRKREHAALFLTNCVRIYLRKKNGEKMLDEVLVKLLILLYFT